MDNSFTKANLTQYKGNVEYTCPKGHSKFVARFKFGTPHTFMTLLRKKFTVEEYFSRLDNGDSPHSIAEDKGYVMPHIKKWLKKDGYPPTVVGFKLYIADQVAKREKK